MDTRLSLWRQVAASKLLALHSTTEDRHFDAMAQQLTVVEVAEFCQVCSLLATLVIRQ